MELGGIRRRDGGASPLMRILHTMAGAGVGGAEAFFVRLVCALHKAGEPQGVVIRPNETRIDAIASAGIGLAEAPFGGLFDLRTAAIIRREVDRFTPDIVMSWMSRAARFAGRVRKRRGFVHVGRLGGYYDLKYYRGCDHLIGNTPDIVDYLVREGWPTSRAHFVPNFVDADWAPAADRAALDTPDDAPVLLLLGRLHENKAVDVAIEAVARMPHTVLWVAGDGPLREPLGELARSRNVEDRVRFLGWRSDVAALLAACDILVCPSRHEPLGNVIIEAWAHGAPVVAAESAGPSWLIEHDRNGLLVPIDDAGALAAAVDDLLSDHARRQQLVSAGRTAFEARFTEKAVVAEFRDLFARLTR